MQTPVDEDQGQLDILSMTCKPLLDRGLTTWWTTLVEDFMNLNSVCFKVQ